MSTNKVLTVNISLETDIKPDERSPVHLLITLRNLINKVIQQRFPGYEVEIGKLEGDWPDSDAEFPPTEW